MNPAKQSLINTVVMFAMGQILEHPEMPQDTSIPINQYRLNQAWLDASRYQQPQLPQASV